MPGLPFVQQAERFMLLAFEAVVRRTHPGRSDDLDQIATRHGRQSSISPTSKDARLDRGAPSRRRRDGGETGFAPVLHLGNTERLENESPVTVLLNEQIKRRDGAVEGRESV